MQVWEIFLLGLALSMDACTVAMTNGMTNPKTSTKKALLIGTGALMSPSMIQQGKSIGGIAHLIKLELP